MKALLLIAAILILASCRSVNKSTSTTHARKDSIGSQADVHKKDSAAEHAESGSVVNTTASASDFSLSVSLAPGPPGDPYQEITLEPILDPGTGKPTGLKAKIPKNATGVVINAGSWDLRKDSTGYHVIDSTGLYKSDSSGSSATVSTETTTRANTVKKCGLSLTGLILVALACLAIWIYWNYFRRPPPRRPSV